jgi:hypothetical protein
VRGWRPRILSQTSQSVLAKASIPGDDSSMPITLLLTISVAATVAVLALTGGRMAAQRAERHVGAWAWIVYLTLGFGMMFGAMSVSHPVLSAFMWTKLTAFILTGVWLANGRLRRRERLFPGQAAVLPKR